MSQKNSLLCCTDFVFRLFQFQALQTQTINTLRGFDDTHDQYIDYELQDNLYRGEAGRNGELRMYVAHIEINNF